MSPCQTVTFMGTTQAYFRGVSSVVWCRKPHLMLANRPFAPTLNGLMGHKTIRLVAPSQKVSDDGWLTAIELPVFPTKWADGVGGLGPPEGQTGCFLIPTLSAAFEQPQISLVAENGYMLP